MDYTTRAFAQDGIKARVIKTCILMPVYLHARLS